MKEDFGRLPFRPIVGVTRRPRPLRARIPFPPHGITFLSILLIIVMGSVQRAVPSHLGREATLPHTTASIQQEPAAASAIGPMLSPKSVAIRLTSRH